MNISAVSRIRSAVEDLSKDRKTIVRIITIVLILVAAGLLRLHESSKADVTVEASPEVPAEQEIYVDIGGAVNNPGVYKAKPNTRMFEIIDMAGGLRPDAETDCINQAAFVQDGDKIVIPVHSEDSDGSGDDISGSAGNGNNTVISSSASTSVINDPGLVNINTAGKEELMTLSGIGEVMADRIIEYRAGNRFRTIEDIKAVKGIGDGIFNKIKDDITV